MEGAEVSVGVWELMSAWATEEDGEGVVSGNTTSSEVKRRGWMGGKLWT